MPERSQQEHILKETSCKSQDSQLLLQYPAKGVAGESEPGCYTTLPQFRHKRLFVALASEPFRWFESGEKLWELRRFGRQFNDARVCVGREVELRRGYSTKDSIWGEVNTVVVAESIAEFFKKVPFSEVIPIAESLSDAVEIAQQIIGHDDQKVIGFRVDINEARDPASEPVHSTD
ncbi:hypothetical protein [Ensifer sp. WSM1721]|uniref:hypothetical protein n=1 Tax=Ensifer sp. WSM1721 TaxID=1041159 RepID=UPI00047E5431|nr:hypothetical protein [Ensifer sp. WSM1721]